MTTNEPIQICILGGGFGGLYTALYLSHFSWVKSGRCQITLVEPKDRFLFSPLLYELLTGELKRWEIAPTYSKLLHSKNVRFCQQRVEAVNLRTREVKLVGGEKISYDNLVLAVGNQTRYADIRGIERALPFRTLADAELLNQRLRLLEATDRQRLRIAVIGGGPSGVELACKLSDRLGKRGQVRLIERGEKILKPYNRGLRGAAERALRKRRVQVDLHTSVKALEAPMEGGRKHEEGSRDSLKLLSREEGRQEFSYSFFEQNGVAGQRILLVREGKSFTQPVDLVLWTAGTEMREWVNNLDCQHGDRGQVLTRPTLQLVDYPEVFALGDLAEIRSQNLPATAQVAYQQASRAAKNIQAILKGQRLRSFRYLHLGDMLTLGKGAAIVSSFSINIEGSLGSLLRRLIYIQRLPTLRHKLQVLKHLLVNWYRFFSHQLSVIGHQRPGRTRD